ncbi:MAG: class I SAM-dependent methyltransferase [Bryobacteraceae bacterium]
MPHSVCPWWIGYLLASPLRRLQHDPAKIVAPWVREGMTVLEPGPGMGFFTLALARRVGPSGRVVAVDIQPKMLDRLKRRAADAGLSARIDIRLAQPDSMGISDLAGTVDFVLAFAMVHEMPSAAEFFRQSALAMKPGAHLLLAEPAGHVKPALFAAELESAAQAGLQVSDRPAIRRSQAAVLTRAGCL